MLPLKIIATGKALPSLKVTSAELDTRLGKPAGTVEKKSGVAYRHHAANHETQSHMAAQALHAAAKQADIPLSSIDLLLSAAGVQEQALPCTASRIAAAGRLPAGMPAFDINCSCLSFVSALEVAASMIGAGLYRRIAIVSSDMPSRGLDWHHPESSYIFGDGAAACIVEAGAAHQGVLASRLETYPQGNAYCEIRAGGTRSNLVVGMEEMDFKFQMDGKRIFRLASQMMEGFIERLLSPRNLRLTDIDMVVPHQASHLSMQHLRSRLKVPAAKIIDIYREHGNQVAASIPTALHEAFVSARIGAGSRILLLGSAAGLTLGGMVIDL